MTNDITRRSFALFSLGAFAMGLPQLGFAQESTHQNPAVLEDPEKLNALLRSAKVTPKKLPNGPLVVDVRPKKEYEAGHISGAVHLDPNAVVAAHSPVDGTLLPVSDIDNLLSDLGVSAARRIVFYDDKGSFHAARMMWLLEYLGHRNVAVLNGGWTAWNAAGGATAKSATPAAKAVFQSAPSPRRLARAEDVLARQNVAGSVLIDVRPPHMYAEGHIPWAINIPWSKNLGDNKRFLPVADLMDHFAGFGVTPDKDVIMHCQNGLASAHSYVALRLLGYPRVRVYHRSWSEWGNDPSLPKATT